MSGLSPLGGAPLGGLMADDGYDLYDTIQAVTTLADYLNGQIPLDLTTSAAGADAVSEQRLYNLRERLSLVDVVTNQAALVGNLSSSVSMLDAIRMAWWMLLEDDVAAADDAAYRIVKALALTDALRATAAVDGRLTAYAACAVAVTMEDAARAGWSKDLTSTAAVVDAVQARLSAMLALSDSAALSDDAVGSLRLSLVCAESANVADSIAANLRLNADLSDEVLLYCSFRIGNNEYSGWAVNTDLRAVTEHRNQPFDSIASGRFHYGAGPNGIVQFTGTDDDGEPIDAYVRTFLTDFGTHKFKRAPDIFVGLDTTGRMLAKVRTRDPAAGTVLEDWYELVTKQGAGEATGRAKVGRGLKSTWWGLELRNINGSDFRIDEAAMRVLVLDRRT